MVMMVLMMMMVMMLMIMIMMIRMMMNRRRELVSLPASYSLPRASALTSSSEHIQH